MTEGLSVIIIATAVAVGFLVVGMSLTLIFKGHHIRSEIGDNPEMRKRGIRCAADEMRAMENGGRPHAGDECDGCHACSQEQGCNEKTHSK